MFNKYLKNIGWKDHQVIDCSGLLHVQVGTGLPTFLAGSRIELEARMDFCQCHGERNDRSWWEIKRGKTVQSPITLTCIWLNWIAWEMRPFRVSGETWCFGESHCSLVCQSQTLQWHLWIVGSFEVSVWTQSEIILEFSLTVMGASTHLLHERKTQFRES